MRSDRFALGVVDLLFSALAEAEAGVIVKGVAFVEMLEGVLDIPLAIHL